MVSSSNTLLDDEILLLNDQINYLKEVGKPVVPDNSELIDPDFDDTTKKTNEVDEEVDLAKRLSREKGDHSTWMIIFCMVIFGLGGLVLAWGMQNCQTKKSSEEEEDPLAGTFISA